ncbi:spore germination protein GerW family protein [Actinophytocola sp.]|uniref:spore germination protein GerW family protein n=1 Tax=Actinophytocola sp. TaxID=1872138 RepID=UPI00389B060A
MKIEDLLTRARETFDARTVFAEPVERDGVTVIPAARVVGGGGGGNGEDQQGRRGSGGGLGLLARPVGAFVIRNGEVSWQPAIDVTRIIATLGAVAVTGLFVGSRVRRKR